jgi:hypothetical protein
MPLEWPLILGAAGVLTLDGQGDAARQGFDGGADWVSPLPVWKGYPPVISDAFQLRATDAHRQHLGVDIMYRRKRTGVATGPEAPINDVDGTKGFFMPPGLVAVACHDGELWSTGESDLGWNVVVDHGKPYATFYQHLSVLMVPESISRGKLNGKPFPVKAGTPLGIVGGSRTGYRLRHLHFEVWRGGGRDSAIDPRSPEVAGGVTAWRRHELT